MVETVLPKRSDECRCGELTAEKLGDPGWIEVFRTHPVKVHFAECPETRPNCPLVTGLRPCFCDLPRCPVCNYTAHDAAIEGDHASCPGRIPDEEEAEPVQEVDRA